MIFLTTGTQLPFDRLVEMVDRIAPELDEDIFGQIGAASYRPKNFETVERLSPTDFNQRAAAARVIVGHAGIGTILTGQKYRKPLVLVARRHALGEHRNDHQIATASQVSAIPGVHLAETEHDLLAFCSGQDLDAMDNRRSATLEALIANIAAEIGSLARSRGEK